MHSDESNRAEQRMKISRGMREYPATMVGDPEAVQRSSLIVGLIEAVGEEAAFTLIRACGGARLYVPHVPEEGDALTTLIGTAAATRLAQKYGGERLELPNPNSRRSKILELRRAGVSVDVIARQSGCTRRRVFQVLAEARAMLQKQNHGPGAATEPSAPRPT